MTQRSTTTLANKQAIREHFDHIAETRPAWFVRNHIYHQQIIQVCRPFLHPDARVLELGCSTGDLLAELEPPYGLGIDISGMSIQQARTRFPHLEWLQADVENLPNDERLSQPFDLIIIEDLLGFIQDIETFLTTIKRLSHSRTRLVVSTWNWLWEPILRLGERVKLKAPDLMLRENWLAASAVKNFLTLGGYSTLLVQPGLLLPLQVPFLSGLVNSFSYAPLFRRFTLLTTLVAAREVEQPRTDCDVSVIIPTRNEVGNIAALVNRVPEMGTHTELIFVDGNSSDGTVEEIHRQIQECPEKDIKFLAQTPPDIQDDMPNLMLKLGKGDAVRKGFEAASGDMLMILDSDISVAPEDLPKFYDALVNGKGQFANGTRFIYSQERGAMRSLNRVGNVLFSFTFSWLLGQAITDTLCGTKVIYRRDYDQIAANRARFGNFDPFGDFDLLFGSAWLGQRIVEIPIRYAARTYGQSKVRISSHGPLLIRMSLIALWHFKIKPLFTGKHSLAPSPDKAVEFP
ncbi:MAG TPA: glycosyltransferase [Aggregatilineales bacterium]|nr:glycosyltransferase [Aggregatilineales bacterium]